MDSKKIADLMAELAENKKANNVNIIDVQKISMMASYFVIASGESAPQLRAIVEEMRVNLKEKGVGDISVEGDVGSGWVIVCASGVIAHVMHEKERKYYNLEELWGQQGIIYHL